MQGIDVTNYPYREEMTDYYSKELVSLVRDCLAVDTQLNPAGNNRVRLTIDEVRHRIDDQFADDDWRRRLDQVWPNTTPDLDEPPR